MPKIFITLLSLAFFAFGQLQDLNAKINGTNLKWETLNEPNYSIQYPSEWELNQSGQMGTAFMLFSPLESGQDQFRENVNLLLQDLSGYNIDLDKYAEISQEQVKSMITNSKIIESKRIKTGSEEYHKLVYTGDQGVFHLRFEQYYWIKNKQAFVLTFTCEQASFNSHKEVGKTILKSFTLKE